MLGRSNAECNSSTRATQAARTPVPSTVVGSGPIPAPAGVAGRLVEELIPEVHSAPGAARFAFGIIGT